MELENGFRNNLIEAGILIPSGVDGLWGRSGTFENIVDGLVYAITQAGLKDSPEVMRFPPAMPRPVFEKSGYMKNFPHLAGTIHSFDGNDLDHQKLMGRLQRGEEWTQNQKPVDIVLTPAACYSVYPVIAKRGALPEGGSLVDVTSYCFRHEPSLEPTRMQFFRMHEYVRIGSRDQVMNFREDWIQRGQEFAKSLGLEFIVDIANDPFFGRAGKLMADNQRSQNLKFELLVPVNDNAGPTACLSFNYHMNYFGENWGIKTANGDVAQTACCGFGMERLTLALFKRHGLDTNAWPAEVRKTLGWERR